MHRAKGFGRALVALGLAIPGVAAAATAYIGGAIGTTRESGDFAGQVTRARAAVDPEPPTEIRLDAASRPAGRIFAGIAITPNFALEADYADLGRLDSHVLWHGTEPFVAYERFVKIDVRAFALSLVANAPLGAGWSVFGRVGAAYTRVRYATHGTFFTQFEPGGELFPAPSPTPPDATSRDTNPLLAIGISYALGDRWSARAEWARYFRVGRDYGSSLKFDEAARFDLDLVSLGLSYRF